MKTHQTDWHLIIAILGIGIAIIAAIPDVYEFVEARFLIKTDLPKQEQPKNQDSIQW